MNKLFTKIATLSVGLAMAIGVGVAAASPHKVKGVKATEVSDTITASDLTATNTTYTDFSSVSKSSDAVYAGQSAKDGSGNIQLRSKNSNSGIVSTTSGGTVVSVTITVGSGSNTVDVYGSNSAYSAASDLYGTSKGTKVGSTSSTDTITFSDSYEYVGIRSNNGAIYLKSVEIVWDDGQGGEITNYTITYNANGGSGTMEDTVSPNPAVASCTFTAPTGKVFGSWNTKDDGTGDSYAVGDKPGADLSLYAIWVDPVPEIMLDKIGVDAGGAYSSELATVDVADDNSSDLYTLNFVNGKKQNDAMILQKSSGAFISNHTAIPGAISSVVLYINSGASGSATYDVAFGTSEYTTATAGIGAVNITAGNNHEYVNSSVVGATYFCVTLGAAYNGQVLGIKITYEEEEPVDPILDTLNILLNDFRPSPQTVSYSNGGLYYANDKDGNDINAEWSSSNTDVFTVGKNGNNVCYVTPVGPGTANIIAHADGYNDGVFVLTIDIGDVDTVTVTGSMSKTDYTTADSWLPDGLVVTVEYTTGYETIVSSGVTWAYDPANPAAGVSSVVATASFGGKSASSSAQSVTVTVAHAGTAADPFNVAEALAKANEIGTVGNVGQGPWVTRGVISRVTSAPAATFWNATYYISDDGKQANELQVYRGFYLDNAKFDAETALLLVPGATVVVTGNLSGSYGCEYCQGNYLLDIQQPESGDIDVTFAPSITSYEIGATGTFTASSDTSGVTYTWDVDESSVLSVDPSTGDFEALGLGVARVTVTATLNDKQGTAFADIIVNGDSYVTVDQAIAIAESLGSGQTTSYYIYVEGFVKEFATSMSGDDKPRAFDISNKAQTKSIMVYTNVNPYEDFVSGLSLGDCVRVKANVQNYQGTTLELTSPEREYTEKTSISFAYELLSQTDAVCKDYDGVTDNTDAIEAFWGDLKTLFTGLNDVQKADLVDPSTRGCGETVLNAVARYDYLVGKYKLDNFISGRTPVAFANQPIQTSNNSVNTNFAMIAVIVVAVTSLSAIGVLLVVKKRKYHN